MSTDAPLGDAPPDSAHELFSFAPPQISVMHSALCSFMAGILDLAAADSLPDDATRVDAGASYKIAGSLVIGFADYLGEPTPFDLSGLEEMAVLIAGGELPKLAADEAMDEVQDAVATESKVILPGQS